MLEVIVHLNDLLKSIHGCRLNGGDSLVERFAGEHT